MLRTESNENQKREIRLIIVSSALILSKRTMLNQVLNAMVNEYRVECTLDRTNVARMDSFALSIDNLMKLPLDNSDRIIENKQMRQLHNSLNRD